MLTPADIEQLANKLASLVSGPLSRWLTLKEACAYARVKKDKIVEWERRGLIYGTKKDGKWFFDRESIDDFYNLDRLPICRN